MNAHGRTTHLRTFFRLAFLLCWGPGALYLLLPQQMSALFGPMSFASPALYLAVFAPTLAALICARLEGRAAFADLLIQLGRWRVHPICYAAAILGIALLALAPRYLTAFASGEALAIGIEAPSFAALWLATLADPGPLGEELGWRGYALPRLQVQFNGLTAALILGAVWAVWHVPAFFISGLPQSQIPFAPWAVCTIALSVIIAWITNRARGSVLPAILAHWTWNHTADLSSASTWQTAVALALGATALVWWRGLDLDRDLNPAGSR